MQDIVIIGAGGLGREVKWLIERINRQEEERGGRIPWRIKGFIDDGIKRGEVVSGAQILGSVEDLQNISEPMSAVCAIGSARIRKRLMEKLQNKRISFPNLIDPSVIYSESVKMGVGNIICAGVIMTVNICIKDFVIVNLDCTVGHDAYLDSYVTVYPGTSISGGDRIGTCTELGTGCCIIQDKEIVADVITGAGAVVVKNITEPGVYCGVPVVKKN